MQSQLVIGSWKGIADQGLAPRELEAVLHCANNRTVKETAKEMHISPATVTKRLVSAKFKLGVSSIRALVLESFRRGLIAAVSCSAPDNPAPQKHHDLGSKHGALIA